MENTPQFKVRQQTPIENGIGKRVPADRLRGVPLDLICNVDEALTEIGISEEYRTMLKRAGLPVLCRIGRIDVGLSNELLEFFKELPVLGERPSQARKRRHLKRKQKPK